MWPKRLLEFTLLHLVRYYCKTIFCNSTEYGIFCTIMRRALFVEWLKKTQSAVFILKLSFAHIKRLFPFAWFSHSSVCAFWGHFSKWCRYSFAVFWCYILCLCLTYIFSTCKCCNYSDCLYSCATHHSFSDWYCKNYFIRFFRKEHVIA